MDMSFLRHGGAAVAVVVLACAARGAAPTLETTNAAVFIEARERALMADGGIGTTPAPHSPDTNILPLIDWGPNDTNVFVTLQDCLLMALKHNLGLAADRYRPGIREEGVRKAWAAFDPRYTMGYMWTGQEAPRPYEKEGLDSHFQYTYKDAVGNAAANNVDLSGGFSGTTPVGLAYKLLMGQNHTDADKYHTLTDSSVWLHARRQTGSIYNAYNSAMLTMPILKGFGIGVNMAPIRIARNNWRMSVVQLEALVQDLIFNVNKVYWLLYFCREDLGVQEYSLYRARELLRMNEGKLKLGMAAALDVTQARARIASQEEAVLLARRSMLVAEEELRKIVNYDTHDLSVSKALRQTRYHLVPVEKPQVVDITDDVGYLVGLALENQQTIEIAKLTLRNADETLKVAKNGLLPDVHLVGSLGFDGVGENYSSSYNDQYTGRHPIWSMGVEMSVPLLYLEPVAAYRQAKYAKQEAAATVEEVKQAVETEVRTALIEVETSHRRIEATREGSKFARDQLNAEEGRFKAGMATTFDVVYYQDQLAIALRKEIKALADWRVSVTALYRSTGRILVDSAIVIEDSYGPPEPSNTLADKIWP